jgi:mono/diheme cytochrome c family protein
MKVAEAAKRLLADYLGKGLVSRCSDRRRKGRAIAHRFQSEDMRNVMRAKFVVAGCLAMVMVLLLTGAASSDVKRGRYLVQVGGCNDCHTAGYLESEGAVPEPQWLTGGRVGFKGPWGITYAPNLRLLLQGMSEDEWMRIAGKPARPPMPWFNLKAMTDSDRRAVYHFIRNLGPAGTPAPAYVAPGGSAATLYVDFAPHDGGQKARGP